MGNRVVSKAYRQVYIGKRIGGASWRHQRFFENIPLRNLHMFHFLNLLKVVGWTGRWTSRLFLASGYVIHIINISKYFNKIIKYFNKNPRFLYRKMIPMNNSVRIVSSTYRDIESKTADVSRTAQKSFIATKTYVL
jgi:hypothetical protein